ncbi:MAG TPA: helix-turn-helix transcriptional regulator [Prolixibacteraceae bacterium]|nr:helix-turn-helix transcriptional regulator [Prolixibacteraceae bacterium]
MIDLKLFRKDNGIKQKEICALLGVKQAYISLIECGDRPLSRGKFEILRNHYGTIIDPYHERYKQKNRAAAVDRDPNQQANHYPSDERGILLQLVAEKDRVIELLTDKCNTLSDKYEAELEKRIQLEEKLKVLMADKVTVKKLESRDGATTSN